MPGDLSGIWQQQILLNHIFLCFWLWLLTNYWSTKLHICSIYTQVYPPHLASWQHSPYVGLQGGGLGLLHCHLPSSTYPSRSPSLHLPVHWLSHWLLPIGMTETGSEDASGTWCSKVPGKTDTRPGNVPWTYKRNKDDIQNSERTSTRVTAPSVPPDLWDCRTQPKATAILGKYKSLEFGRGQMCASSDWTWHTSVTGGSIWGEAAQLSL